jgi:hypothetical protein
MSGVAMDGVAQQQALDLRAWLNGGTDCWLELWTNPLTLNPSMTSPTLYQVAVYPGYVPIGTLGLWPAPVRLQPGVWYVEGGPWQFAANGGSGTYTLAGWRLRRQGKVIYAESFDALISLAPGGTGPALLPRLTVGSQSVLCPD